MHLHLVNNSDKSSTASPSRPNFRLQSIQFCEETHQNSTKVDAFSVGFALSVAHTSTMGMVTTNSRWVLPLLCSRNYPACMTDAIYKTNPFSLRDSSIHYEYNNRNTNTDDHNDHSRYTNTRQEPLFPFLISCSAQSLPD